MFNSSNMSDQLVSEEIRKLMGRASLSVTPSEEQLEKMTKLVGLLLRWNSALNLTAIKDPLDVVRLHIVDSACIEPYIKGKFVADIGTGAGFPGLVLAILHPEMEFTLIDSISKKISFVRTVAATLCLKNVTPVVQRVENFKQQIKFNCITCRAFAQLDKIVTLCRPILKKNGIIVAMKANVSDDEINSVQGSVEMQFVDLNVPGIDAKRSAVIIRNADNHGIS